MCGDRGQLPHELFRCSLCRLRMQHRYCSDLYPRVPGPYRSCNWCLTREDGREGRRSSPPVKAVAAGAKRRLKDSRDDDDSDREEEMRPCGGGCTTSEFSADPEKPVKKPKKGRQIRVVQRPVARAATEVKTKRREVQAGAGGKARFRVKVRRYKLLAEVIR